MPKKKAQSPFQTEPVTISKANPRRRNRARCRKCGDVIESKSANDFVRCGCAAIAVDGGQDYFRRVGDLDAIEEMP